MPTPERISRREFLDYSLRIAGSLIIASEAPGLRLPQTARATSVPLAPSRIRQQELESEE